MDRARAIIEAMESIESDYENLRGVLPKSEYLELDNAVLGQLLLVRRQMMRTRKLALTPR